MFFNSQKPIRVAEIISNSQIVLNIGIVDGASKGDEYIIYEISDNDIIDPNTGGSLGRLEIYKGIGQIIYLQDTMCILQAIDNSPLAFFNSRLATKSPDIKFSSPKVGDYAKPNAAKVQ